MSFTLREVNSNNPYHLHEEAAGRPVMLTFWTSWCPDSNRDLHEKMRLYKYADASKLCFVTINVTGREGTIDLQGYLEKQGFDFLVLKDEGTRVYDSFGCVGVPTTILLNERLEVVHSYGEQAKLTEIMDGLTDLIR